MLSHLVDALPVRSGGAVVRRHFLECSSQVSLVRHLLHRHRRQGSSRSCSSTSAPRASQARVGPVRCRRRPLAGCRLSRRTVSSCPASSLAVVAFPPRGLRAVGTAFRRPSGTTRPSDSSRPFVISFFRPRRLPPVRAEAERSPRVRTQNFVPTPSPLRAPADGYWASLPMASSPPGRTPLTALRFRSVRYCTLGFHQTPPRGWRRANALVSLVLGSLRQGPKRTCLLMSHLVVLCPCRAHQGQARSRSAPSAPLDSAAVRVTCSGYGRQLTLPAVI